ncbi:TadE/TadG family type IV pilus assembly protein [Sulfitobacter sabulilitoris]|uniref:Pilus assembly protein n=1 Tax=Sulfitobacter sabulilitoris TaxID=2562655 RepID=A0A5S3PL40_9RHOB|nr:hypothetical protein [Sulfitobacter sabulilitoris]TMM55103.1 hypothetical protein FDT80_05920 [Sulfitobacter sabulilitoris]
MTPVNTRSGLRSRKVSRRMARFWRCEDGSYSIEAVIWMPIFALILAVITNVSIVFASESHMLRVVQDANRAFSLGRHDTTTETEDYIRANLAYLKAQLTVTSVLQGGTILSNVSIAASDLMPLSFFTSAFEGVDVNVTAQHIIEF